jgi:hypothetical protein
MILRIDRATHPTPLKNIYLILWYRSGHERTYVDFSPVHPYASDLRCGFARRFSALRQVLSRSFPCFIATSSVRGLIVSYKCLKFIVFECKPSRNPSTRVRSPPVASAAASTTIWSSCECKSFWQATLCAAPAIG